ncbi:class I SAM-dependent methyltransferase [Streptomyces sp. NPDC050636]|uniref:class I SAM-dependent methyltransferase n=1 Tax=Streptomyces sp. NPDC050636 TaxID=3154510 RepID=UPI0034219CB7
MSTDQASDQASGHASDHTSDQASGEPADQAVIPTADQPLSPPAGQAESPLPTPDAAYWEAAAEAFDDEPDHGLRDPAVRAAWDTRLRSWLPSLPGDILDLGCGTGSLALLAVEQGHRVTGVDRSAGMIARARAKLAGRDAGFLVGDAAEPPVGERRFDAVLVRHVLWALPDPAAVLRRWAGLLVPGGRLVLIEGRWGEADPIGIPASELAALTTPLAERMHLEQLSHDAALWGKEVNDERYALIVHTAPGPHLTPAQARVHTAIRRPTAGSRGHG